MLGAWRNLGRVAGALVLPLAASARLPRRCGDRGRASSALAASIAGQVRPSSTGPRRRRAGFAFGAALGWDDTLFSFLAMEAADPRLAASTFALFMAVTNLSVVGDALFARGVDGDRGVPASLLLAAAAVGALASLPAWPGRSRGPRPLPPSARD